MEASVIGNIIAKLRKERNLTQEDLADRLGVSFQAVSKWETGASCPDITLIPRIADCFGVSTDYLFGRESRISGNDIEKVIAEKLIETEAASRYKSAFEIFRAVFDGISSNIFHVDEPDEDMCTKHVADKEGIALISYKGFGALIESRYFKHLKLSDAEAYAELMSILSDADCLRVLLAAAGLERPTRANISEVLSMDQEKTIEKLSLLKERKLIKAEVSRDSLEEIIYRIHDMIRLPILIMLCACRMVSTEIFNTGISCKFNASHFDVTLKG